MGSAVELGERNAVELRGRNGIRSGGMREERDLQWRYERGRGTDQRVERHPHGLAGQRSRNLPLVSGVHRKGH